ncbi:MAG: hypothetical protein PWQ77_204 [Kosmotogales bacterium]|nr:hypothetical protein [Kosmotogales bacterium]
MGKKWKILEIIFFLCFTPLIFCFSNEDLLQTFMDTDMEYVLSLKADDSSNWQAAYAIVNSFLYKDSLDKKYERRFYRTSENINTDNLTEEIGIIFGLSKEFMKSSVKIIKEIDSIQNKSDLLNFYYLHVLFHDWKYTKDPKTADKLISISEDLHEKYPGSLYTLYALLYYNTNSKFGSADEIEKIKDDILNNEIEALYSELLTAEFNLENYSEVLKIFDYISENDADYNKLKTYWGISFYKLGETIDAETVLKSVDRTKIDKKLTSVLYEVLGNIYYKNDEFSKAIEYYGDSLVYDASNYNSLKNLGLSHYYYKDGDKGLARYYLQVNDYEQSSEEVKNALKKLRFDHVFNIFLKSVLPIITGVIVALFLLEYIHKRNKKKERDNLLKNGNKNS